MNQLQVKTSKFQLVLLVLLALFFIPVGLGFMVSGLLSGFEIVPIGLGFMMLATMLAVGFIFLRGYRRSVKHFTNEGVTRNDGKLYPWTNLKRVVDKMAIKPGSEKRRLWRTELQFDDGASAWLIPLKVSNYEEVNAFISTLQCERAQEDA